MEFLPTRLTVICLAFWLSLAGTSVCRAQQVEITDDLGNKISLDRPAQRIIPLYGAFSEVLFSIGAGDRVIARTQADKYPAEIEQLPSVGTHMKPNIELILGLKPDLVIMSSSRRDETPEISRLLDSGIPVAIFSPKTFDEIFAVTERLGTLCGKTEEALKLNASLRKRLDAVKTKLAGLEKKQRVFFEIRSEPLTGAGRGSIVDEIISAAGGENVLTKEKGIVKYSVEALLFDNPDAYVVQEGPMNKSPLDPSKRAHFDQLKCVREGRVIKADELVFSRPGPRCIDAVESLAAALYPEVFKN